jgi:hypothetical protein
VRKTAGWRKQEIFNYGSKIADMKKQESRLHRSKIKEEIRLPWHQDGNHDIKNQNDEETSHELSKKVAIV